MIVIKKKIQKEYINKEIEILNLFKYKVVSMKEYKDYYLISFQVDEYNSRLFLYNEVSKKTYYPFIPVVILSVISIVLISSLLILFLINKSTNSLPMNTLLMAIGIPALVSLLFAVCYTVIKTKTDVYNIKQQISLQDIKSRLEEIK